MRNMLEDVVGGFKVERIEREYRPTRADVGGLDGWVRLMARVFIDAVPEGEREEVQREVKEVLGTVCVSPSGGEYLGYVRLRVLARKV